MILVGHTDYEKTVSGFLDSLDSNKYGAVEE